jgi:hypothetical protein
MLSNDLMNSSKKARGKAEKSSKQLWLQQGSMQRSTTKYAKITLPGLIHKDIQASLANVSKRKLAGLNAFLDVAVRQLQDMMKENDDEGSNKDH